MKKMFLITLMFIVSISINFAQNNFKKYPYKSGIIKYEWKGFMEGEQTVYFDDYGYLEATYQKTVSEVMGFSTETNEITIVRGAEQITIDLETKTAVKIKNPVLESFEENPNREWEEVAKEMMKSLNFKKVGTEKIIGKNCDVYEGMGKVWIWNGLNLKTETKSMGIDATVTATEIKLDVTVPSEKFEIPEGITISDGPDMEGSDEEIPENMKEMMEGLKNMLKSDDN
jgi:hypothetical protein